MVEGLVAFAAFDVAARAGFVAELPLVSVFVGMAAGTSPFAIRKFRLGLVTARTGVLGVFPEQRQTEFAVIDARTLEGSARNVAAYAVHRSLDQGVRRGVAVNARLR